MPTDLDSCYSIEDLRLAKAARILACNGRATLEREHPELATLLADRARRALQAHRGGRGFRPGQF